MGKSYREFCDWLELCSIVLKQLGMSRMPHFTTLQKFSRRADPGFLDRLLGSFAEQVDGPLQLAVDSTGFSCTSASYYFITVLQRNEAKEFGPGQRAVRRHIKQTIAIDIGTQLIVTMRHRLGPTNDAPDMIPVLEAVSSNKRIASVVADKGYDSNQIRRYIWYRLKAESHIPLKKLDKRSDKENSVYRRKQARVFDETKYHRRALIETVHSVEKRVMRDDVLATSSAGQHAELRFRAIAYNSRRLALTTDDFY